MLDFTERMYAHLMFRQRVSELSDKAFEGFFQEIMARRHPDFLDIRTHGNIGDMGADGLWLGQRKVYACYAPEVVDPAHIKAKVGSDIGKAIAKRAGQFDTFVFAHNDLRGMHPVISTVLSEAATTKPDLSFEQMRPIALRAELLRLSREDIEDILGTPIAVADKVWSIGLEDLKPLLDHLVEHRAPIAVAPVPDEVPPKKMEYNRLGAFEKEALTTGMTHSHLVQRYYDSIGAVTERDEVAANFSAYYREVAEESTGAEDVFFKLQMYVAGNARQPARTEWAIWVVIAYFFETCDLFETPPPGWTEWEAPGLPDPERT